MGMKIYDFHIKGCAPTLVLKQRPGGTRTWPIAIQTYNQLASQHAPIKKRGKSQLVFIYLLIGRAQRVEDTCEEQLSES